MWGNWSSASYDAQHEGFKDQIHTLMFCGSWGNVGPFRSSQ